MIAPQDLVVDWVEEGRQKVRKLLAKETYVFRLISQTVLTSESWIDKKGKPSPRLPQNSSFHKIEQLLTI